ncbi:MAG: hypothetical protein ACT4OS_10470 [Acidimicrobiales bacterium]
MSAARQDCRHYSSRTLASGDRVERCRLDMAALTPFTCPADCLFFEARPLSDTGWSQT